LWSGIAFFDNEIEKILVGTWAGEILGRMKAHHKSREADRHAREAFQDPANVQKRREEKKRLN